MADVGTVLISAAKLAKAGNEVNLSKSWLHLKHPCGDVTPLIRRWRVLIMNMSSKRPQSEKGFMRQGVCCPGEGVAGLREARGNATNRCP